MAGRLFIALCFVALAVSSSYAATFIVNSTLDEPDGSAGDGNCETIPGNGICTFRGAIQEASAITSTLHKILVPAGIYLLKPLSPGRVELLPIGKISIEGAGIGKTIIDATDQRDNWNGPAARNQYPVFFVVGPQVLTLSKLTIKNSHYEGRGSTGVIYLEGSEVNSNEVEFTNNTAASGSAAITNFSGTLNIRDSRFLNNSALGCGAIVSIGTTTISNTTFAGNKATAGPGGAICSSYSVVSRDVLISDRMSITNSTFAGNSATAEGGAILVSSFPETSTTGLKLLNVTFDSNSSPFGANIGWPLIGSNDWLLTAENTILSNPLGGGENCMRGRGPQFISRGHNISSDSSCPFDQAGDLNNTDPLLGPLADNGGLTQTQALLGGSPAIDAGSKNCTVFDQRGTVRPIDGNKDGKAVCDVGAVEALPGASSALAVTSVSPETGSNVGETTVTVRGNGFGPDTQVQLRDGNNVIATGKNARVLSPGKIIATFDLKEKSAGAYKIAVTDSVGHVAIGPRNYNVQGGLDLAPGKQAVSVAIIGPSSVRPGNTVNYQIVITNNTNTDVGLDLGFQLKKTCNGSPCAFDAFLELIPTAGQTKVISKSAQILDGCVTTDLIHACHEKLNRVFILYGVVAFQIGDLFSKRAAWAACLIAEGGNPLPCSSLKSAADAAQVQLDKDQQSLTAAITDYRICLGTLRSGVPFNGDVEDTVTTCAIRSSDPNDKIGPNGHGVNHAIAATAPLPYGIRFENKPEATAAAQTVIITDVIDSTKYDLSTFTLGPIAFGDKLIYVPSSEQQFVTAVDLRPANNLIVRIDAGIDLATGIATWRFESIDPITGLPTTDPIAGFLPPNKTSPEGQGSVLFTVQAKSGLASGTTISNKASIVFDTNDPIETPTWSNTLDMSIPSSAVEALASTQATNSFAVKWAGADIDSGMRDYTIFVSVDGATPTPWLVDTIETSATYTGEVGKTYAFYSVARDNVGNIESSPATPDATTKVVQPTAAGNSSGGGGGGCTIGVNKRFDLSFILLLLWFWIPKYSRRALRE